MSALHIDSVRGGIREGDLTAMPVPVKWHSDLPIYASEAFLKMEGGPFGWIGGLDDQARLVCVLPYTIIQKFGFQLVRFRTATIPILRELELDEERQFLNAVVKHFRSTGAGMIIPSGNTAIFRVYPSDAVAAPYGTVINDLSEPEDVMMTKIRKDYRQNIRKATAGGVEIKRGLEYLDKSYDLIAETLRRSGSTFKNHRDFSRMIASFGPSVEVFVAEHGGVLQGCMVSPFSHHTAYSCYAGSKPDPVRGAMNLLHWEALRHFRSIGVRSFDFQGVRINPTKGSKQDGILTYKQGFGGRLVSGFLWKYPLRRLPSMAYSVAVRFKLGGDTVDHEQHKLDSALQYFKSRAEG